MSSHTDGERDYTRACVTLRTGHGRISETGTLAFSHAAVLQATMTTKGQITIPARLRTALNVKTGEKVVFITRELREVVIVPVKRDDNKRHYLRGTQQILYVTKHAPLLPVLVH